MEELNPGKLRQKTMPPGIDDNQQEEKIFKVEFQKNPCLNLNIKSE